MRRQPAGRSCVHCVRVPSLVLAWLQGWAVWWASLPLRVGVLGIPFSTAGRASAVDTHSLEHCRNRLHTQRACYGVTYPDVCAIGAECNPSRPCWPLFKRHGRNGLWPPIHCDRLHPRRLWWPLAFGGVLGAMEADPSAILGTTSKRTGLFVMLAGHGDTVMVASAVMPGQLVETNAYVPGGRSVVAVLSFS